MPQQSLIEQYRSVRYPLSKLFVVPLIFHDRPNSDYLYNLYKELFESADSRYPSVESLSVFSHFKFVVYQAAQKNVLLHYHWFEFQDIKSGLGMIWKFLCIYLYKLLGGTLIWTIHNKKPHRNRWLKLNFRLRRWMAQHADKLHVHCERVIPELSRYFEVSSDKFFVYPHPRFPSQSYPREKSVQHINQIYNAELSIGRKRFLTFGNIARYKQIEKIIPLFAHTDGDTELVIAGTIKKGNKKYYNQLEEMSEPYEHIKLIPRYIPDHQIHWFFNSSDYVLFNHRRIIQSGAVEIARSYEKEIIAPAKGCLKEYAEYDKIQLFSSQKELKNIVHHFTMS